MVMMLMMMMRAIDGQYSYEYRTREQFATEQQEEQYCTGYRLAFPRAGGITAQQLIR